MRILPGLTASPAAATVKKGTYPISTRVLPMAGPVFTPLKAPTRTITNPILAGPFISTQERAAATKNVLTSVTQKPSFGPLVLPKPYVAPKPVVQKNLTPLVTPKPSVPFQGRPVVTPVEQVQMKAAAPPIKYNPQKYNPEVTPVAPLQQVKGFRTGLDYFNRYTETALSTVGAIADTYAGYAWNKDTWNIAKERIKNNFSQIWSPPALEEAGVPAAIGRAAGNALSLAGTIITTYTLGKALVDFEQQLALNARRVAYYGKLAGQNPEEAVPGIGAGGPAPKIASERSFAFTPDEMRQGIEDAMSKNGMTRQQATDYVNILQEIVKTPYDKPSALTYQSNAKEPGFAVGSAQFDPFKQSITQTVPTGLPAGQGDILGFVIQFPDIAVKTGVVASASAASQLATLSTQVMAGQAAVTNLQAAMTASIPSLGVLAHYADLTRRPINEVMAEQARLAVPVGQPVTTRQTVAPAPVRTAIPAQATAPVSRILPYATEAPPISSPVATISTRQLPIASPIAPTTQPVVQTMVRPAPSATTEPWQMTADERQSKIAALQVQYKRELATPLMSEGNISPMQVGQMSKNQLARFQQDGQTKFVIEAQIQDLEHPELAKVRFDQNVAAKNQEQITALQSRLGVLQQFGQRKNGMMRSSYQKEMDKVQTQLDTLVAPTAVVTPAPLETSPSAAISNKETGATTPVEATALQNVQETVALTPEVRAEKIARKKELRTLIQPLMDRAQNLTEPEVVKLRTLTTELDNIDFAIARPLAPEKIPSEQERKSTLSADTVLLARSAILSSKPAYDAIVSAAQGVYYGADTAVDDVVNGKNQAITPTEFYNLFSGVRDALKREFGDTITLYRSVGQQKGKATTNWSTTKAGAEEYGGNIVSKDVLVDDVLAVNVSLNGKYHEVIVGTPPTAPVVAPAAVTPVTEPIMQAATITPTIEVKWGKWKKVGDTEYHLVSEPTVVRQWGKSDFQAPTFGNPLQFKNDTHSYYLVRESAVPAKGSFPTLPASYRVVEAKSGNAVSIEATEAEAVATARRALDGYGQSTDDRITELVALHGGVANTVTNAAPLPAGQTTSGEVAQTVTNMVPDFVTSGTGTTIPAEKNDIARITAVFDKAASAMWSGKLTPTTEGSYQKAFYDALVAAGVPKNALGWGKAITYYRETKNAHGLENRLAKVAAIVEKYNNKVLAEQMAKGREHAQTVREQQEKILEVRQAGREKLAQSEQAAATRLREQQTNDRIASEIEVGKQKHIDRAVAAALAEKEANLAKTAEWLHAEKALSARNKAEIASIVEYIENLDLRYMHAAEAKAIQEEAGAAGLELKHPFVAPGDTAFVWAMQNVGLHVVDSSVPLVEQQVLNLPELRALQAKVKAIADLSKEEKDVIKTRRQEALNKEIDDCVAELSEHITEKNIPDVRTGIYHGPEKKSNIANVLDKLHEVPVFADIQLDRQQYLFQVIGGYRKRALYNSLYNKIYGADRATARSVNTDIALAHERLVQAGITPKTMSKERTLSNGIVVTQRDVIFAAVYAGNTNTLSKMMESNGWTEEDIRLSIESMSKEEVAWTNYMLDDMRLLYPQVSDAFAEINQGASLPDIMNYFPAIGEKGVDVALGQPGKAMVHPAEQMTLDSLAFYGWGQGDTLSGNKPSFVKHREGGKMVLQVDPISSYFSYKESALDYINRAPVASSMRAIVADARFKDAFLIVAGEKRYKALMEYVEAIANPQKALAPKNEAERAARVLRWNASAGTLSLRLSKAVTAFMSYGLGFGRYSPTAMLYGTHKLMGDFHGSMAEIKQYAPLLYQRLVDPVRWDALIADAERGWGGNTHIDPQRLANLGFAVGDTLDVASSFLGYTWSLLRQHLNDPAWTMERAAYVAERDLLQTHTSRLVQDRPAAYRGTELTQALVAFTGEATSQSMALMFDAKSAYHGTTPKAKFIAEWFTLTMGVALMGMLADAVARGRKKKTAKESGFWDGIWGRFLLANIETFIPIAGRWITGSLRGFTGANDIITLKAVDEVKQLIPDIIKGNFGKATMHLLRFVGFGVGIPVLGFDELKNWINPDNAASTIGGTISTGKPKKTTVSKPHK